MTKDSDDTEAPGVNRKRDTIQSLAKEIRQRWPSLMVLTERSHTNTDRKIGRLRWPGKGRTGMRIIVKDRKGVVLLDHDNSETYRRTSEVREWMVEYGAKTKR